MKKALKIIVPIIVAIAITFAAYSLFMKNRYHMAIDSNCPHLWILKDSIKKDLDTNFIVRYYRDNDNLCNINYKQNYNVAIWEFEKLNSLNLKNIKFNLNCKLDNLKYYPDEVLNADDFPNVSVKLTPFFSNEISVNLNEGTKIIKNYNSNFYKGFYGKVRKLTLNNELNEPLVLIDYYSREQAIIFLIFKARNSFFIIIIDGTAHVDESMINILNLE